jgi:hypothetical protein
VTKPFRAGAGYPVSLRNGRSALMIVVRYNTCPAIRKRRERSARASMRKITSRYMDIAESFVGLD